MQVTSIKLKCDCAHERITCDVSFCLYAEDYLGDQTDFLIVPRHQELLGDRAKECDISVIIEKTGLEDRGQYTLSYVLFRCVSMFLRTCLIFTLSTEMYLTCVISVLQAFHSGLLSVLRHGGDSAPLPTALSAVHQSVQHRDTDTHREKVCIKAA